MRAPARTDRLRNAHTDGCKRTRERGWGDVMNAWAETLGNPRASSRVAASRAHAAAAGGEPEDEGGWPMMTDTCRRRRSDKWVDGWVGWIELALWCLGQAGAQLKSALSQRRHRAFVTKAAHRKVATWW